MRLSSIEYRASLKDKILEESWKKFSSLGFKAVKMDDIAKSLGISKRTLYEVYPNKEEILYESILANANRQIETIKSNISATDDVMDIFAEFFRLHLKNIRETNPLLLEEIKAFPKIKALMEENKLFIRQKTLGFLKRGQAEGFFIMNINTELFVTIHDLLSSSISKSRLHEHFSPDEIFPTMVVMMIRSICTETGLKRIDAILHSIGNNK